MSKKKKKKKILKMKKFTSFGGLSNGLQVKFNKNRDCVDGQQESRFFHFAQFREIVQKSK